MAAEGINGFYKSLVPLWGRQIPYTMMKFACFEKTVVTLYDYVVPKPRAECSKAEQLVVTFAAGYIAGVFCAIVSHPRYPGVVPQQGSRCRHWCCREDPWFWRTLAGSWPQDYHDWNPDCSSMVHL